MGANFRVRRLHARTAMPPKPIAAFKRRSLVARARARTFAHAQQMCVKTKSVQNLRNLVQLFWGNFCASLIQYTGTCAPLDKSAHKSCSKVVVVVVVRTCALAQATLRLSPSKINIYLYRSPEAAAAASLCAPASTHRLTTLGPSIRLYQSISDFLVDQRCIAVGRWPMPG